MKDNRQSIAAAAVTVVLAVVSGLVVNELSPGFHRMVVAVGHLVSVSSSTSPSQSATPQPPPSPIRSVTPPSPPPTTATAVLASASPSRSHPLGKTWPSVIGRTMKSAYFYLRARGLAIGPAHGIPDGVVADPWVIVDQKPRPGQPVGQDQVLEVWLRAP